jgi:hypothetical protein
MVPNSDRFKDIESDESIVMPNHFHGIINISSPDRVVAGFPRPWSAERPNESFDPMMDRKQTGEGGETPPLQRKWSLGQMERGSGTTKDYVTKTPLFQGSFQFLFFDQLS